MNLRYQGRLRYMTDYRNGSSRFLVAVPCQIGGLDESVQALLDTGSEWCVLSRQLVSALALPVPPSRMTLTLHTRLGRFEGYLDRLSVRFIPLDGEPLDVDASWFVSSDWPGPTVLGWRGCLERMRFAVEPDENWFYFGRA